MNDHISRRGALAGGLGGAGLLALAACGGSAGGAAAPHAFTRAPVSPQGGLDATSAAGTAPAAAATKLAALDTITVGEAVSATLAGKPVIVARPSPTTAACFSAICTHQGCTVAPVGKQLQCPCHGSVYNATTGAVISGPAPRALNRIQVTVEHGEVVAGG